MLLKERMPNMPFTPEVGLTASENTELSASQLPVNSPQTQCSKVGVEKARGAYVCPASDGHSGACPTSLDSSPEAGLRIYRHFIGRLAGRHRLLRSK